MTLAPIGSKNLATDPRAVFGAAGVVSGTIGWDIGRWFGNGGSGNYSLVSGAVDGPVISGQTISTYHRKTWTVACLSNGDTGFNNSKGALNGFAVTPNTSYAFVSHLRANVGGKTDANINLVWYNAAGAVIGAPVQSTLQALTANVWKELSLVAVSPATAAFVYVVTDVDNGTVWQPGNTLDGTAIMVQKASTAYDYFDGSTPGGTWDGTPNASTSTFHGALLLATPFPDASPPYVLLEGNIPTADPNIAFTDFVITRNGEVVRSPLNIIGTQQFSFKDYDAPFGEELTYHVLASYYGWTLSEYEDWDATYTFRWTASGDGSWALDPNGIEGSGGLPSGDASLEWDEIFPWTARRVDIARLSGDLFIPSDNFELRLTEDINPNHQLLVQRFNYGVTVSVLKDGIPTQLWSGSANDSDSFSVRDDLNGGLLIFVGDVLRAHTVGISWQDLFNYYIRPSLVLSGGTVDQAVGVAGVMEGYVPTLGGTLDATSVTTLAPTGAWLYHADDPALSVRIDPGNATCSDPFATIDTARSVTRQSRTSLLSPLGSTRDIAITTGPRRAPAWALELSSKTAAAYDAVVALFESDATIRFDYDGTWYDTAQLCGTYGMRIPKGWYSPGELTEIRDADDWRTALRRWQVSLEPSRAPTTSPEQDPGFDELGFDEGPFGGVEA